MKKLWLGIVLLALAAVGAVVWATATPAQTGRLAAPLDYKAVFRTHIPHINAHIPGASKPSNPGGNGHHGGGTPPPTSGGYSTTFTVVTPTTTAPEAEEHIAVDPNDSSYLVAAISDFFLRGGYNTTKYAYSSNNGTSWNQSFVPKNGEDYPVTSDGKSWEANSDPVVAIDNLGNVYLEDLYFNGSNNYNGLYVCVGGIVTTGAIFDPSGITCNAVATNTTDPNTNVDEDKDWIAVDNSSGDVYASWTHFVGNTDYIMVSKSTNHGASWSATPVQVSDSALNGAVQGSQIAVGPDGTVYVVFQVYYVGNQGAQYLTKSTDGGATWSASVPITPLYKRLSFNSTYRKDSFASLAVGPGTTSKGTIYVVYADQVKRSSSVEFIRSTDGGNTFSSPVALNDTTSGQRLMPSVAADNDNNYGSQVHTSWFDTRNSTNGTEYYDIYVSLSKDRGTSFSTNQRVTSLIDAGQASFIGDYGGEAALSGSAHPVWTNGGFNNGKLQTATLTPQ